jgi:glutathione synthase/RimK-type ligase-like ATP-grasp enzyme
MTVVILCQKGDAAGPPREVATARSVAAKMRNAAVVKLTGEAYPAGVTKTFRWGCTANAPVKAVVNTAQAIHFVADKPRFRRHLRDVAPDIIPITWFGNDDIERFLELHNHLPLVVRPSKHTRGEHFHVVNDMMELSARIRPMGEGYYISKFYQKRSEYRVEFVQNRVVWVYEKIPNNRALHAWGRAANWNMIRWGDWNLTVVTKAYKAFKESGLDFGAVDVIVDRQGDVYVCEVNSAPEFDHAHKEERVAQCFDWMIDNNYRNAPPVGAFADWKNFIHPALSNRAV